MKNSDTHREWTISQNRWPEPAWSAVSPNYDAWTEGEGGWVDNGEKVDAPTRDELIAEIDAWFEENAKPCAECNDLGFIPPAARMGETEDCPVCIPGAQS